MFWISNKSDLFNYIFIYFINLVILQIPDQANTLHSSRNAAVFIFPSTRPWKPAFGREKQANLASIEEKPAAPFACRLRIREHWIMNWLAKKFPVASGPIISPMEVPDGPMEVASCQRDHSPHTKTRKCICTSGRFYWLIIYRKYSRLFHRHRYS